MDMSNKRMKKKLISRLVGTAVKGGLLMGCLTLAPTANAGIIWSFNYTDAPGVGFNDVATGSARKAALETAGTLFSTMFGSYFTNSGTIVMDVTGSNVPGSGTLASAGSYGVGNGTAGFGLTDVVRTKLVTGVDLTAGGSDGLVDVNFAQSWQFDPNVPVSNTEYDFFSTMSHEFTHALGFSSSMAQDGSPSGGTPKSAGSWELFDKFLGDKNGNAVVDPATFALNQATWDINSVGGTSPNAGLFFHGANAVAANGGQPVGLYTPTTWSEGSSVSHLDTDNPVYAQMMMAHASDTGLSARNYSNIEVGMLQDLGYTVAVVPEPSTYVMMLAGLGMVGWKFRRRVS